MIEGLDVKTNPQATNFRLTVADLLTLTAFAAASTFLFIHAWKFDFSPGRFANSLDHNAAATTMIVCTFGLIAFPAILSAAGILFFRKTNLALRIGFAWYLFLLAAISVPVAYAIAGSCACAIGG